VNSLFTSDKFVGIVPLKFKDEEGRVRIVLNPDSYSKKQIRYPVRGDQCDHLQVFDLLSNLEI